MTHKVKNTSKFSDQIFHFLWHPTRVEAIAEIRALLALNAAQIINMKFLTDDMIWDKLMAAEVEAERLLKAFFNAVEVIPDDSPPDEIAALEASNTRYVLESNFDYNPDLFRGRRVELHAAWTEAGAHDPSHRHPLPIAVPGELRGVPRLDKALQDIRRCPARADVDGCRHAGRRIRDRDVGVRLLPAGDPFLVSLRPQERFRSGGDKLRAALERSG
ncbi:hypothetical protein NLY09_14310 (plasmid) [Burkholderia vietnamiensis]